MRATVGKGESPFKIELDLLTELVDKKTSLADKLRKFKRKRAKSMEEIELT
jgi:hypothetical protein